MNNNNNLIDKNQMSIKALSLPAANYISSRVILKGVRPTYEKDEDDNMTTRIENVRYDCVDPASYNNITIKVNHSTPIITKEELENADNIIMVDVPIEDTVIRPYKIEYGKAYLSIIAPSLSIASN